MKICMVAEGCYPYVVGGVSGWIHSMIKAFPQHEFIILAIISDRKQSGKFQYEMPDNVSPPVPAGYGCRPPAPSQDRHPVLPAHSHRL